MSKGARIYLFTPKCNNEIPDCIAKIGRGCGISLPEQRHCRNVTEKE